MTTKQTGDISVNKENIFPVIKKWLYSEKDIFLRELVSNACDAVTKLRRLQSLGKLAELPDKFRIDVRLDKEGRTLTVEDNGIGMSSDEVQEYICSIAFSGAVDFLQKYEGEGAGATGIIGHFGLGFYSAFMVSDRVEIHTKSYTDAPAVHWDCDGAGSYTMEEDDRAERGTEVILHIADGEEEYLDAGKIREMLHKYCAFMPVEIYFDDGAEKKDGEAPAPVNDTEPLWQKSPADIDENAYKEFYHKLFADYRDPLFQIHINADYPLNFKGILYFPHINNNFEPLDGQIKLYYNQVFVSDSIKEILPDYLLMLRGVLDCPELPLNVSRSYLQDNAYISKVSAHIVKKVADKLLSLCRDERETYEKIWDDVKTFVEYAAMREQKFSDRVKAALLFKLTSGKYSTLSEYLEAAKETNENTVYYTNDRAQQSQYIAMYEANGIQVVEFDSLLDTQFAAALESREKDVEFLRVDAGVADALKAGDKAEEKTALADLFRRASGNDKLKVETRALKDAAVPALLNVSEESRRMEDMMRMYKMAGGEKDDTPFPTEATLLLNTASPLILSIEKLSEKNAKSAERLAAEVYRLSLLSQRKLTASEMQTFLAESYALLTDLAEKGE